MNLEQEILAFLKQPEPERFEELAIRLYEIQRQKNRPYDLYCRALGVSVSSWREIPGLPQQAFKHSEIRSFPVDQTRFEFRTSGTTGEGYGRHFLPSLDLYRQAVLRGWDYAGLPRYPIGLLLPRSSQNPHSSLARMGTFLSENKEHEYFWKDPGLLDLESLRNFVERQRGPIVLFGTALAFVHILESSDKSQTSLPEGSLILETGGFKGSSRVIEKSELYRQLSNYFTIPIDSIWNEYGMTELSSQFYSSGVDRPLIGSPWTRVVIIDPNTNRETRPGQIGMIRIIDLANVWSVLSIQTQDLAQNESGGEIRLLGRDPNALPRGCSRAVDEILQGR
jgi:acyl-CoA synthetase (AMP-forming)/AMP-acid ligase II